jgi:predicted DNA-binding protein (UPF0251 family)
MPRRPVEREVYGLPRVQLFKPAGIPARELDIVRLAVDELEAMRLVDGQGMSHEEAAAFLGVSRQTVGRILESGRRKVTDALVGGKGLAIGGGRYRLAVCELRCVDCDSRWSAERLYPAMSCPSCGSSVVRLGASPEEPAAETGPFASSGQATPEAGRS